MAQIPFSDFTDTLLENVPTFRFAGYDPTNLTMDPSGTNQQLDVPTLKGYFDTLYATTASVAEVAGNLTELQNTVTALGQSVTDLINSLGDAATKNVGTAAGTVAAGDHVHPVIDGITLGTAVANKAVTTNSSNQVAGLSWLKSGSLEIGSGALGASHLFYSVSGAGIGARLAGGSISPLVIRLEGPGAAAATNHGIGWSGADLSLLASGTGGMAKFRNLANTEDRDATARDFVATRTLRTGSFTVATLPTPGTGYRFAGASNGRKAGEGAAAGTGCPVWDTGSIWATFYGNAEVQA